MSRQGWLWLRYNQPSPPGGCSPLAADAEREAIGARSVGSLAGEGSHLATGQASPDVASVELRLSGSRVIEADLVDPPAELRIPWRFFVEFLPPDWNGAVVLALGAGGDVLATEPLNRQ